jgi:ATP-dependent protease ClpP protease subunit
MTDNESNHPSLPSLVPDLRLFGPIDQAMLSEFFRQQAEVPKDKPVVLELSTSGGDADIGRRIAEELRLWQEHRGRELYFWGKTFVFSAGVTIMAAIPAARRFLTHDCELLIHERKLGKDISLNGSLRSSLTLLHDAIAEIESGQRLEREGFTQLVKGTRLSLEELQEKVFAKDWYLPAPEACKLGLVAGIV